MMTLSASPQTNWNALLEDIISGVWKDPTTGKSAIIPFETILIEDNLDGREADLVAHLRLGKRLAVVSDTNTFEAMGRRVGQALKKIATIDEIVLPSDISCDAPTIANIQDLTRHADGVVSVGSGVLSDSCKYATFKDGRPFAVFGTAASMNGYAASTASVTLSNGFKVSLPAHAPRGIFLDLAVTAASPTYLSASGLGDSLCRPTAQVDWWTSHRLFGTLYSDTPYLLQRADEAAMLASAAGLATGDRNAAGHLQRVLTLCGLGVCFTGVSNHGSMGEHQVSHWVDMFAGDAHPSSTHGQQVGVASLAIARLQHRFLAMETPPEIGPTRLDEAGMIRRYGSEIGLMCIAEARKKAMNADDARAFNRRLASIWPTLRSELAPMLLPVETMTSALVAAKGPIDADTLGLPRPVWRDALKYAREIRNRWSFLDLADDAGLLDDFLDEEQL